MFRTEVLGGLVVALALIPEAISFSVIAGVDPAIGLFSSFTMAVVIACVGGRPAMISAATGAVALGVAKLIRFVPRAVMVGFVNSLAILVFMAQVPEMRDVPWAVYPLLAGGLALMVFFPKVTKAVPAPLVSIVILTAITVAAGIAVPTVGDKGALPSSVPVPGLPDVPFTLDTLALIAPYALAMAVVGLMESLMTAKLVDEITDTRSQGIANIVTGFFGGMGGCALIGQTMINVKPVVSRIPMAALVAVMVMVCFATFDWHSIAPKTLRRMPAGEITVMVLTVACVVATHNLAVGVVAGSVTAVVIFAKRVAHLANVTAVTDPGGGMVVYSVTGELFFASSNELVGQFDYAGDPDKVVIDLSGAHVRDASSVAALDAVEDKYRQRGKSVEITGLNEHSARLHGTLSGGLLAGH
ncbi:SulP family inorganic anion transporter [Streptomyces sp. AP-93]|uniref:SulP family inorganic anion transporter n=1 Tax=Streptomyces sp. AP-93 TaxID=2929048 RepID=UPI001FAFE9C5|nr:SulP family inorganic anion transporter [Streptomyces sp. AP-93]MCJ0868464.1 SulP family inorganic anion transporter [Streptomyces sp. AP-93]